MTRTAYRSDALPAPAGPYSPSVGIGAMVATAGQGPAGPDGVMPDGITAQTEQCLRNVMACLAAAGASEADVLRMGVFLTDVADFAGMNEVYRTFFSDPPPARTTVYVTLPAGMLVEIDALAVVGARS